MECEGTFTLASESLFLTLRRLNTTWNFARSITRDSTHEHEHWEHCKCCVMPIHQRYVREVTAGNLWKGIPCLSPQCLLGGASATCDPAKDRWISLYKSKESLSVCVCVCVCVYVCMSVCVCWFKDVQRRICLDCNDTVNKLFHKCFTNSASIAHRSHHSHVRTRVNHCRVHCHPPP